MYKVLLSEIDRKLSKLFNFIVRLSMKRVKIYIFFSITYVQIFFPLLSKIDRFFDRRYIYISLSLSFCLSGLLKKKKILKKLSLS